MLNRDWSGHPGVQHYLGVVTSIRARRSQRITKRTRYTSQPAQHDRWNTPGEMSLVGPYTTPQNHSWVYELHCMEKYRSLLSIVIMSAPTVLRLCQPIHAQRLSQSQALLTGKLLETWRSAACGIVKTRQSCPST